MAYTPQKAIDHARTGRFNATATDNAGLVLYGEDFARLIGQYKYARDLAKAAYSELLARHNQSGNPRYNGPLTNREIAAVNRIANAIGQHSPFAHADNWYGRLLDVAITDEVIDPIYAEISEIYDSGQTTSLRSAAAVLEQVHRFLLNNPGKATPAQEKTAAVLILVFTLAVEIMANKLKATNRAISMGPDASVIATFDHNNKHCLFVFSDFLDKLSAKEILDIVSSDPADAIINADYHGRPIRLCIGSYVAYITSFQEAYATLKNY